jgi:hypothetical protein
MLRFFALALVLVLAAAPVRAQFLPVTMLGTTYQGPGDVVGGATAWYGLRAYNAAYAAAGGNAINIRRTSDSTTADIKVLPTGSLDVATATTFCASTTCYVTKWYDQSGANYCTGSVSCNAIQGTAGSQPQLLFNCVGALPCIYFSGSKTMTTVNSSSMAQPISFSEVVERTGNFSTEGDILDFYTSSGISSFFYQQNQIGISAGSSIGVATAADSVLHAVELVVNGNQSVINVDGTASGVSTETNATSPPAAFSPSSHLMTGYVNEAGFWRVSFTSLAQTTLCHNQRLYWGTTGTC